MYIPVGFPSKQPEKGFSEKRTQVSNIMQARNKLKGGIFRQTTAPFKYPNKRQPHTATAIDTNRVVTSRRKAIHGYRSKCKKAQGPRLARQTASSSWPMNLAGRFGGFHCDQLNSSRLRKREEKQEQAANTSEARAFARPL